MPEGPEVYNLAQDLNKLLTSKTINIKSQKFNLDNGPFIVSRVFYLSKKIVFELNEGFYLVSFLGMSGGWSLVADKYNLAIIESSPNVYYNDMRRFGRLVLTRDLDAIFKDKGPDWVLEQVTFDYFKNQIDQRKDMEVCKFLMDTKITTGVGNYLKSDALFIAQIHPQTRTKSLSDQEVKKLFDSVKKVVTESKNKGGFSKKDYFSIYGKKGAYTPKVYGMISVNGMTVLRGVFTDKRTSWFCPELQKLKPD